MVVVETSRPVAATRKALLAAPGVQFVEGELLPALDLPKGTPVAAPAPKQGRDATDPMRKDQWALDTMGVPKVWEAAKDLKSITVGLVDTGVDGLHSDLKANLVPGWNAANPGQNTMDEAGHGTMTAGCIAAVANNGIGVAGVAPNAKVMPIKVGNSASSVVDAMIYAADHTDMISMSLSFKPNMDEYQTAVETTRRAAEYVMGKKIPMVCSMGNTGTSSKNVPSYFAGNAVPGLIAVGATDKNDKVTSFSTYGNWTSVSAPGAKILTTSKGGGYSSVDGTSFSTPLTAGVVALMLGNGAPKDPAAIKKILMETAVDIDAPGTDDKAGAGRVDAFKAVIGASGRR
jgi:subtilisin family serine protease